MKQIYYAIQNIVRGKDSNIVKIISITLGLLISIILFAKVSFEMSYDTFLKDSQRIFSIKTAWEVDGKAWNGNNIYPTSSVLLQHFPDEVESATTLQSRKWAKIGHGGQKRAEKVLFVDSLYFQTMGITLQKGNAMDMAHPDIIFLSESFARELFGGEDPMGKTVTYEFYNQGDVAFIVRGIFADMPENTTLEHPKALVSIANRYKYDKAGLDWNSGGNYVAYAKLKEGKDVEKLTYGINAVIADRYFPKERYGQDAIRIELTPLLDEHLQDEETRNMLLIMGLLAAALLLTATLNYVLISLSSMAYRAKGIAIHKCSGAEWGSVFGIFLWETAFIVIVSVLLMVFISLNAREIIEELTQVSIGSLFSWQNLWAPCLTVMFLFLVGSIIPGIYFSSVPVTQVFRKYTERKRSWKYPLLFVQFGGVAFLFGLTGVMYAQYHYTMNKDLGYDITNVVSLHESDKGRRSTLLSFVKNAPYVSSVATSENTLMEGRARYSVPEGPNNKSFIPRHNVMDRDYFDFIGLHLKVGKVPTSTNEILVNEAFVKEMGWTSNGVGEYVADHGTVTGIVDGYLNTYDVAEMVPWEFRLSNEPLETIQIRLKEPFDENLIRLNEDVGKLYPNEGLAFNSFEKDMENLYHRQRIFRDSTILSTIAILAISLMGLIGYTNEEVRRRSKEIAIRKINGAEVGEILHLLCMEIFRIALPSALIGLGLAHYVGNIWKEQFRDMLPANFWLYAGIFIVVMAFILGTVIVKSWRVANENPVVSIKSE